MNEVTEFFYKVIDGDLAYIKASLEKNNDLLRLQDEFGNTALHIAAGLGHVGMCRFLLSLGADVNVRCKKRMTPLHAATFDLDSSPTIIREILCKGACLNARDVYFMSPLMECIRQSNLNGFVFLLGAGARTDFKDRKGRSLEQITSWILEDLVGIRQYAAQRRRMEEILRIITEMDST